MSLAGLQESLCGFGERRRPDERLNCALCPAKEISLCKRLDPPALKILQSLARRHRFLAGSMIFEQGNDLTHLHVITQGLVKLYHLMPDGRRQITGFLGPGDLLGGIKRHDSAFCSATAMTDVSACSFDRQSFAAFLQNQPDLCLTLLVVATDEIEAQYEHSILLARKQASERMAAFLLLFALKWQTPDSKPNVVRMPMPRSDVADYLGLSIETVSRVLARLKRLGMIDFLGPKTIVLKNPPALSHLAGIEQLPPRRMAIGL